MGSHKGLWLICLYSHPIPSHQLNKSSLLSRNPSSEDRDLVAALKTRFEAPFAQTMTPGDLRPFDSRGERLAA